MKAKIQPHILCQSGDIAPYVLLPGDPGRVLRMAALLDSYKEIVFNREYRVVTGLYRGVPVTICSTGMGGPAAAIGIEELIKVGGKVFIRVGSCGANDKKIKIGDLIISDSVIRQDHTCLDYVPLQFPAIADPEIFSLLTQTAQKLKTQLKFNYYTGPTVSVDALYSPKTKESKTFWQPFGALAQDMEAATVLTLARIRKVKAGVILLVVDTEGEKNVAAKIAEYSTQAKNNKGFLVEYEKRGVKLALETIYNYHQKYHG
ncbi:MAG: nucleoside phosphorylase [Candidatus Buchananbacteria bacterium]